MALNKKKLVTNIVFYTLIVIFYGFVLFAIITKFNGGSVYFFNTRYDVVLTDSMSAKNENHLDFLEGTSQIQALDMISSKKVDENTKLKEKDVVLFINPDLNNATVMHRIVQVIPKGDELKVYKAEKVEYNSQQTVRLLQSGSSFTLAALDVVKIELEFYTPDKYADNYTFVVGGNAYTPSFVETQYEGFYKYNLTCTRSTSYPAKTLISLVSENENYIRNIVFTRNDGSTVVFDANDYENVEGDTFSKLYNIYYLYEIRADRAKDSDGIFTRDKILSKVDNVVPKAGYVVRFITSIPGIVMFIGIALIITAASYFYNKEPKKKEEVVDNSEITEEKQEGESNE